MRLLLVEDDLQIASFLMKGLKQAGFAVDHAADGEEGLHMLPNLDGLCLIEELRRQKINTPVLILSAKRTVDDRVRGLQTGGDDYLIKPFAFPELLARVQALIRRVNGSIEPTSLKFGHLSLDLLKREVHRSDKRVDLQPREFALLEYLMRNAERVVSKTMILEHIWDYQFDPQTNVVDVLVSRLRSKVDKDFPEKIIHTIRGIGYVLKGPS